MPLISGAARRLKAGMPIPGTTAPASMALAAARILEPLMISAHGERAGYRRPAESLSRKRARSQAEYPDRSLSRSFIRQQLHSGLVVRVCRLSRAHGRVCDGATFGHLRKQHSAGEVIPVLRLGEQSPAFIRTVCGGLPAKRSHRAYTTYRFHPQPPVGRSHSSFLLCSEQVHPLMTFVAIGADLVIAPDRLAPISRCPCCSRAI
jgi:hypothetical protein